MTNLRKLKFGDSVENIAASQDNPTKCGFFVRSSGSMVEYASPLGVHHTPADNIRAAPQSTSPEIETSAKPTEAMVLAGGEVLLAACSSPNGNLHPWKPFDVAQVAIKVYRAMMDASPAPQSCSAGTAQPKSMWQRPEYDPERSLLEAVHDLAQGSSDAADAARYRHLKEHASYYYPEEHNPPSPREFGIEWHWQDSTPERLGMDALIDREIEEKRVLAEIDADEGASLSSTDRGGT